MTSELFFLLALFHGAIALITTSANLYIGHRRHVSGQAKDAINLRLALAAELANLREIYKENIDALYAGKDGLVSCRMFSVIYRGNLGRLHTLKPDDIAKVVTAYAMSERVEAFAAVHGKAHGANAFSLGKERPYLNELIAHYEKAAAAAERALRTLTPPPAPREEMAVAPVRAPAT